jgi:Arc/MetJ-type ribon-helix-helix transcriptional regulator
MKKGYSERLSISFTVEQMRRIEEILRVRAKQGKFQHKTDVIREAINFYLSHQDDIPGTRAAITRKLEGRFSAVEEQLEQQAKLFEQLVAFFKRKRL